MDITPSMDVLFCCIDGWDVYLCECVSVDIETDTMHGIGSLTTQKVRTGRIVSIDIIGIPEPVQSNNLSPRYIYILGQRNMTFGPLQAVSMTKQSFEQDEIPRTTIELLER